MKVKLQTRYANPLMTAEPGSVIDVSEEEARDLVAGHFATVVATPDPETAILASAANAAVAIIDSASPARETAALVPPELAASRHARGSRGRTTARPAAAEPASE